MGKNNKLLLNKWLGVVCLRILLFSCSWSVGVDEKIIILVLSSLPPQMSRLCCRFRAITRNGNAAPRSPVTICCEIAITKATLRSDGMCGCDCGWRKHR